MFKKINKVREKGMKEEKPEQINTKQMTRELYLTKSVIICKWHKQSN